jgi:hypothetical protein
MTKVIDWNNKNTSDKFIEELVEKSKVYDEKTNTLNLSSLMDELEEAGLFKYWMNK